MEALSEPFDPTKYQDHYREALVEVITNKTEGREVVAPEEAGVGAGDRPDGGAARERRGRAQAQARGEPTESARKVRETAAANVAKHSPDKHGPAKHTARGRKSASSTKSTKRTSRSKTAA